MTTPTKLPTWLEALAASWDGCMYDAPGEMINIGASIRAAALAAPSQCLHQIAEPAAAPQAVQAVVPMAGQSRFIGGDWGVCSVEHVAMVLAAPNEWKGYEVRYLYAAHPHPAEGVPAKLPTGDEIRAIARSVNTSSSDSPSSSEYVMAGYRAALAATPAAPAAPVADALDAERYRWLRERDLDTLGKGGVFAGMTPDNVVLNGNDLDSAIDAARAAQGGA